MAPYDVDFSFEPEDLILDSIFKPEHTPLTKNEREKLGNPQQRRTTLKEEKLCRACDWRQSTNLIPPTSHVYVFFTRGTILVYGIWATIT